MLRREVRVGSQVTDGITSARNVSFWHEPANRLQNADSTSQWGTKIFYYDGVGNRIEERTCYCDLLRRAKGASDRKS